MSKRNDSNGAASANAPILGDVALAIAAIRRSRFEAGDRVAVLGLDGPAIAAARLAREWGAAQVDCIGGSGETAERAGEARLMSAGDYARSTADDSAASPRRILLFASSPGMLELAVKAVDRRGVIVVVGAAGAPEHASIPDYYLNMIMKETAIIGISTPVPAEQQEAEELLQSGWRR
jgi:D-arabinose 1-dehydrogenase-like Zn-dependent alcohol dehydrogenase